MTPLYSYPSHHTYPFETAQIRHLGAKLRQGAGAFSVRFKGNDVSVAQGQAFQLLKTSPCGSASRKSNAVLLDRNAGPQAREPGWRGFVGKDEIEKKLKK